jgi:toxin YoeB
MSYSIEFTQQALLDIDKHKKSGNKVILFKLLTILQELVEHPFYGTGKPELLKYDFNGYWSRRISKDHRIIYRIKMRHCLYQFCFWTLPLDYKY